jgi:ATP-dependent Lhr-like helicase
MATELTPGGFTPIANVLKAMEDAGRVRRGLFVEGLGAMQFAQPAALDLLRSSRTLPDQPETVVLASTDPANPYGGTLRWPAVEGEGRGPTRSAGTTVILADGHLAGWLGRRDRQLLAWLPEDEPGRGRIARGLAAALVRLGAESSERDGLLIATVNGQGVADHPLAAYLTEAGFARGALGMTIRRRGSRAGQVATQPASRGEHA